ncbi:MAG: hypothetical protein IKZ62_04230 [Prevotella sp.]|nr:hypothetical protein [Prevotella sp.]
MIMKKMMMMAMMMVMTITANAMSYNAAKNEALFLSDKMAYELNLTDAQYDAVYEINLDYLMSVNGRHDAYGTWWNRRNTELRFVLNGWQFNKFMELTYFYRPITWHNGAWRFHIYSHYDRTRFFKHHPTVFASYKGGHTRPYHAPKPVAPIHHHPKHDGPKHIAQKTSGHHVPVHHGGRR